MGKRLYANLQVPFVQWITSMDKVEHETRLHQISLLRALRTDDWIAELIVTVKGNVRRRRIASIFLS
jgi:hypothetical protein